MCKSMRWHQENREPFYQHLEKARIAEQIDKYGYLFVMVSDCEAYQVLYHPEREVMYPFSIRRTLGGHGVAYFDSWHELFWQIEQLAPLCKWSYPFLKLAV